MMSQALISKIHRVLSANQKRDSEFNVYNNANYHNPVCVNIFWDGFAHQFAPGKKPQVLVRMLCVALQLAMMTLGSVVRK